jgi:hypothetical protein
VTESDRILAVIKYLSNETNSIEQTSFRGVHTPSVVKEFSRL